MSHPIKTLSTNRSMFFQAYEGPVSTNPGLPKLDLEAADITSLSIDRSSGRLAAIPVAIAADRSETAAHVDGSIFSAGNNVYMVDVPDSVAAVYVPSLFVKGTWTDNSESGYLHGIVHHMTGANIDEEALGGPTKDWFRLLLRNDPEAAADLAAVLAEINSDTGSGTGSYAPANDSVKAGAGNAAVAALNTEQV